MGGGGHFQTSVDSVHSGKDGSFGWTVVVVKPNQQCAGFRLLSTSPPQSTNERRCPVILCPHIFTLQHSSATGVGSRQTVTPDVASHLAKLWDDAGFFTAMRVTHRRLVPATSPRELGQILGHSLDHAVGSGHTSLSPVVVCEVHDTSAAP